MQKSIFLLLNPLIATEIKLIASDCVIHLPVDCNQFFSSITSSKHNLVSEFCLFLSFRKSIKMGKKSLLSDVQRAQIVALYMKGYSERSISERIKRSKNAVHNAVVKFKKTGTYSDAKRSGRPRKTTSTDDHIIWRTAIRSPMSFASKIRSVLLAKGADISRRTVNRRQVIDFGLKARKRAKKPRLRPAMKAKRLGFAKKHAKLTIQQWQQVFFSDESTVQQFTTRKRYVHRPTGKRFDKRYTTQTMKHPPSVMIWGMSVNEKAGLFSYHHKPP